MRHKCLVPLQRESIEAEMEGEALKCKGSLV